MDAMNLTDNQQAAALRDLGSDPQCSYLMPKIRPRSLGVIPFAALSSASNRGNQPSDNRPKSPAHAAPKPRAGRFASARSRSDDPCKLDLLYSTSGFPALPQGRASTETRQYAIAYAGHTAPAAAASARPAPPRPHPRVRSDDPLAARPPHAATRHTARRRTPSAPSHRHPDGAPRSRHPRAPPSSPPLTSRSRRRRRRRRRNRRRRPRPPPARPPPRPSRPPVT